MNEKKKKYYPPEIHSEEIIEVKVITCGKCEDGSPTGGSAVCDPNLLNT